MCVAAVIAMGVAACGDDDDSSESASSTSTEKSASLEAQKQPELASKVPESIRSTGELKDIVNPTYPPMEYKADPGGPVVGVDIDLARALAQTLGLKLVLTETPSFDALIPAVQTNRADIAMSAIGDLPERREVVHFVDYFVAGEQFYGLKAETAGLASNEDMCGKKVTAQSGTAVPDHIGQLSEEICGSKDSIEVLVAGSTPDMIQQVKIGRVVALVNSPEGNSFLGKQQSGQWRAIGTPFSPRYYGIAFPKDEPELGVALRDALDSLIKSGVYKRILAKWDLEVAAVDAAEINGTVSP
jgi:polar amino acid transport system substrate-binding protein